ncbi:phage BR0599 family protein [Acinetobacter ursingii]|uniref:phage BR0599 family protein n=1 Tax=Acinetobacter ursingii TaxID=108980 RepID=UPI00403349DC
MSFSEYETSLQNGRPIRLYQFQRGPIKWGYTNADRNISHQNIVFRAIEGGISDDGIRQTEDSTADLLTLTVPSSLDVAQMFRTVAPGQTVSVTIFDLHFGDNGYLVVWMGLISGVRFKNEISAEIQCQTLAVSLERTGLRKTWSRICPHQLYDDACQAPRNSFKTVGLIDRLDAVSIGFANAAAQSNNYYSGGYIEWTSQYGLEQRGIELHQSDLLTIYGGTYGLSIGQEIAAYAGCDRLFTTCQSKFNNSINYGGSPHMPGKSPFDGTPVF